MKPNSSPWLRQLKHDRASEKLTQDIEADIAIIGAGIAGISTAFYALKHTTKRVVVLERFKLAHGATGHNAGQIVSYFERGFSSLVREFGLERAAAGQKAVEDAWHLLDEMYTEAGLDIPLSRFTGHAALSSEEQVLLHLENNLQRREAGLNLERILVASNASFAHHLPEQYKGLYQLAPHHELLEILETRIPDFVAVLSYQKGCMNSALFCQEILNYLLKQYPERFALYEHVQISKVLLRHESAVLDAGEHTVTAGRVVLCTNGFEGLTILNETGLDIDAKYHHLVEGYVGYMSGYLEKFSKPPTAISYFTDPAANQYNPYFYLTRRPYEYEPGSQHNLISIGGPGLSLEGQTPYSKDDAYPEDIEGQIDSFVKKTYAVSPHTKIDYAFTWHGLMGYTRNGVRLIGPEPQNPVLLYNLGCNGVGILPSIHGGRHLARHLCGERVLGSIFDIPPSLHLRRA